jgi:hypothetical protein
MSKLCQEQQTIIDDLKSRLDNAGIKNGTNKKPA